MDGRKERGDRRAEEPAAQSTANSAKGCEREHSDIRRHGVHRRRHKYDMQHQGQGPKSTVIMRSGITSASYKAHSSHTQEVHNAVHQLLHDQMAPEYRQPTHKENCVDNVYKPSTKRGSLPALPT
jgi:hypothetical protein